MPRPCEDAVDYIGRVHGGIELIEFPDRPLRTVLITAGTGLMLSLMDACPSLRWCIDVDGLSPFSREKLSPWLTCIGKVTDLVVIAGWYCSTNPEPLARATKNLDRARACIYVQCRGVGDDPFEGLRTADSLSELVAQVERFHSTAAPAGGHAGHKPMRQSMTTTHPPAQP